MPMPLSAIVMVCSLSSVSIVIASSALPFE